MCLKPARMSLTHGGRAYRAHWMFPSWRSGSVPVHQALRYTSIASSENNFHTGQSASSGLDSSAEKLLQSLRASPSLSSDFRLNLHSMSDSSHVKLIRLSRHAVNKAGFKVSHPSQQYVLPRPQC